MDRFAELEAFAATIELGSQAAAAASLGLSRMAVSRLIRTLEERIGEPLLIRTTRSPAADAFIAFLSRCVIPSAA